MLNRLRQRFDLEHHARAHDIVELLAADRRHPEAALAFAFHEALGHQTRKRFAQRADPETVGFAELVDAQLVGGRELSVDDIAAQVPISTFELRVKELAVHSCDPWAAVPPPGSDVAAPIVLIVHSTKRP